MSGPDSARRPARGNRRLCLEAHIARDRLPAREKKPRIARGLVVMLSCRHAGIWPKRPLLKSSIAVRISACEFITNGP